MSHKITVELEVTEKLLTYFENVAKVYNSTVEEIMVARLVYSATKVHTADVCGDLDE
jgi:hypothetical protein